tara:strand:+ start:49 stop:360 length:312 start_codon:yes stop_codon:yes gene_type:complete
MIVDTILLTVLGFFGLWVINKHFDNAYDIEELIKQVSLTSNDMRKMQEDLIEFKQSLINIDAKYGIKEEWIIERLFKLTGIIESNISVQDSINLMNNKIDKNV